MKGKQAPFWLLTIAALSGLVLLPVLQQGMYLDGVSYAAISRNMAQGIGYFCQPQYTQTLYPVFYEQVPLALWLESLFFRLFGDAFWVERLYSLLVFMLSAAAIVWLWQILVPARWKAYSWLPVLLWSITPIVFWSYQNNMLENTMTVFVLLSSVFFCKAMQGERPVFLALGALSVLASVLSKGPVGFFPLVVPLLYALILLDFRPIRGLGWAFLAGLLTLCFFGALLLAMPCMLDYFQGYAQSHLLPALSDGREAPASSRFYILWDLVQQCLGPLLLLAVSYLLQRKKRVIDASLRRVGLFFLVLGVCGSLPLIASLKQALHYLGPCLPFFALGFAAYMAPMLDPLFQRMSPAFSRYFSWLMGLVLLGILFAVYATRNGFNRDAVLIAEVNAITRIAGERQTIACAPELATDWLLVAYLQRLGGISLDAKHEHVYYLGPQTGNPPSPNYKEVESVQGPYRLYKASLESTKDPGVPK